MPVIRKVITGKMNSDASNELMPSEDFKDGLNVTIDTDGIVSINGNRRFTDSYLAVGYWCAGAFYDKTRRRVLLFLAHENQRNRITVCHLDVEATVTMYENLTDSNGVDILEWDMPATWTASKVIKNINVVHRDFGGDLVYFIDPLKRPLKFNFDSFVLNEYGARPTIEMFKVIKYPPASQPSAIYIDDATRTINNLKKKLFQFKYRFVYSDDEKSVWSAISNTPLPPKNSDQDFYADGTKSNAILLNITTGVKTVVKIEIAARNNVGSNWTDFYLIDTVNKSDLSINDDSSYSYTFYNNGAYNYVDVAESNLLHDYVPDEANCMELANGNVVVYGGIKEGLDKEVDLSVDASVETVTPSITTLVIAVSTLDTTIKDILFTGTVSDGDTVRVDIDYYTDVDGVFTSFPTETFTYLVGPGGSVATDVIPALVALMNASPAGAFVATGFTDYIRVSTTGQYQFAGIHGYVTSGAAASPTDSVAAFKPKGRHQFGIAYYRNDGKTRGVYIPTDESWTIDIPAYAEASGDTLAAAITLKISNAIPSWADYFHIVQTKELTAAKASFVITGGCGQDTDYTYLKIDNLDTHAVDFPSTVGIIPYKYREGDRVRIIKRMTATATILDSYDFEILGVVTNPPTLTGDFIKIKKSALTSAYGLATTTNKYLIEIYTPAAVVDTNLNVYYERALRFPVYTDVNRNRSHTGNTQNQIQGGSAQPAKILITSGDYYIRQRVLTTGASGVFTDGDYFCFDTNFSDVYVSGVHNEGRPLVIDDSIKKQYYPGLIRHSLQYIQGTNINLLSRFYPESFEDADASYGDVLAMKTRENFIRVFQRFKVGMMPVFRQMYFDTAGSNTVATSERVLNKINYYNGDYGIDKYGLSLVSTDYGDYFIDDINRAFIRASLDGITNVNDTFMMRKFFNDELRTGYTGHGVFDYERREVIMTIVTDEDVFTKMVRFSESRKGFQPRYSFTAAQKMLFVEGWLWSVTNVPYVHDNEEKCTFFDEKVAPFITVVFNGGVDFKKNFTNIKTVSNRKWGVTAITTSLGQTSELKIEDFKQREDGYEAGLLRDSSSPGGLTSGDKLKGNWIEAKFEGGTESSLDTTDRDEVDVSQKYNVTLMAVTYTESNLNKR